MVRPQSLDEAARNCRRRVGWSWTGSVAVDMAECRLDFETMHHGQRSGARPDHPITGSRIIRLVVRSEYKQGMPKSLSNGLQSSRDERPPGVLSARYSLGKRPLMGQLNRGVDGVFELVCVVGRGL